MFVYCYHTKHETILLDFNGIRFAVFLYGLFCLFKRFKGSYGSTVVPRVLYAYEHEFRRIL